MKLKQFWFFVVVVFPQIETTIQSWVLLSPSGCWEKVQHPL